MALRIVMRTIRDSSASLAQLMRPPRSSPSIEGRLIAATVTALLGVATGVFIASAPELAGRLWLAFFAVAAPAIAITRMLPSFDLAVALIIGVAGGATVNAIVVEAMLAANAWSITGGVIAVAVVAALVWLIPVGAAAASPGEMPDHRSR